MSVIVATPAATPAAAPAAAPALEPVELTESEHLLLWALRAMAIGGGDCPALRHAFVRAGGPLGEEALACLFVAVKHLAFTGRRRLSVHVPGCRTISRDEQLLLQAFAAVPAVEADGWGGELCRRLAQIVGGPADPVLRRAVAAAGRLLPACGLQLPRPEPAPWAGPASVALH